MPPATKASPPSLHDGAERSASRLKLITVFNSGTLARDGYGTRASHNSAGALGALTLKAESVTLSDALAIDPLESAEDLFASVGLLDINSATSAIRVHELAAQMAIPHVSAGMIH